ncbi:DsbA family protein [Edaphobacter aggregans]|uniref:DsbA family protein n=1 Tax=Edaphobacter aggregans TaxID=570835 RepID=UPI001639C6B7|nr:thioredoxin domain-containing protein [Edaphobacter aggregans]
MATGTGGTIVFFLSPDQRFLSISLSDTTQSPLIARAKEDSIVESQLTKDLSPGSGEPSAPLRLVVFEDYQCPYCKRLDEWLKALSPDLLIKIRISYKNFPLAVHPFSSEAAAISVCAGLQSSDAYGEVGRFLFSEQNKFGPETLPTTSVIRHFATSGSVSVALLRSCLDNKEYLPILTRDRLLAESLKVPGTPTVFLNGRRMPHLSSSADLIQQLRARMESSDQSASNEYVPNPQVGRQENK